MPRNIADGRKISKQEWEIDYVRKLAKELIAEAKASRKKRDEGINVLKNMIPEGKEYLPLKGIFDDASKKVNVDEASVKRVARALLKFTKK